MSSAVLDSPVSVSSPSPIVGKASIASWFQTPVTATASPTGEPAKPQARSIANESAIPTATPPGAMYVDAVDAWVTTNAWRKRKAGQRGHPGRRERDEVQGRRAREQGDVRPGERLDDVPDVAVVGDPRQDEREGGHHHDDPKPHYEDVPPGKSLQAIGGRRHLAKDDRSFAWSGKPKPEAGLRFLAIVPRMAEHAARISPHPGRILAVLALGGGAYAMLQSLVVPALPTLQRDFDTTPTGVTWIFTAYLLAASVATPIAGRLGDMFGKKRTLVVVLAGLGAGTLLAALGDDAAGDDRRPRDPGARRRDLPAGVRNRPRRVPAEARRRRRSRSSRGCSASARGSGSSSPGRSSPTSTTTGSSGSRSS